MEDIKIFIEEKEKCGNYLMSETKVVQEGYNKVHDEA